MKGKKKTNPIEHDRIHLKRTSSQRSTPQRPQGIQHLQAEPEVRISVIYSNTPKRNKNLHVVRHNPNHARRISLRYINTNQYETQVQVLQSCANNQHRHKKCNRGKTGNIAAKKSSTESTTRNTPRIEVGRRITKRMCA